MVPSSSRLEAATWVRMRPGTPPVGGLMPAGQLWGWGAGETQACPGQELKFWVDRGGPSRVSQIIVGSERKVLVHWLNQLGLWHLLIAQFE